MMPTTKKSWLPPHIEIINLEFYADVLGSSCPNTDAGNPHHKCGAKSSCGPELISPAVGGSSGGDVGFIE